MLVRKWKKAKRVRETRDKAMNWNEGLSISEKWEDILVRESIQENRDYSVPFRPLFLFFIIIVLFIFLSFLPVIYLFIYLFYIYDFFSSYAFIYLKYFCSSNKVSLLCCFRLQVCDSGLVD